MMRDADMNGGVMQAASTSRQKTKLGQVKPDAAEIAVSAWMLGLSRQ